MRLDPTNTLAQIGLMLSISGLDRLVDPGDVWHVDARALEDLERYGVGPMGALNGSYLRALEELTEHRRAAVAVQAGPRLIQQLIAEIKRPIERLLAVESTNKGGRPPDVERRHVIIEAKKEFEAQTNKRATKDEAGPFVHFCDEICVALDLETDTLGSLVAEVLHPRTRKRRENAT